MSRLLNSVDFDPKKLVKELRTSINDDKMYWIRNDAKIRASLTSQNYDEFRDIVAAAHLKPLTKGDKNSKANIGWNKCISSSQSEHSE